MKSKLMMALLILLIGCDQTQVAHNNDEPKTPITIEINFYDHPVDAVVIDGDINMYSEPIKTENVVEYFKSPNVVYALKHHEEVTVIGEEKTDPDWVLVETTSSGSTYRGWVLNTTLHIQRPNSKSKKRKPTLVIVINELADGPVQR